MDNLANGKSTLESNQSNEDKIHRVQTACYSGDIDVLASLASSPGGFINDELRRKAWPVLLGVRAGESKASLTPWEDLPPHQDEQQIKLDVDRSFIYYPRNKSESDLEHLKRDLLELITETLRRHRFLCYPQGYHDIVQVMLLVLGRTGAVSAVERLSLLRVRDFLHPSILPTLAHLRLLLPILRLADPKVERHVSQNDPAFALAATLTMYAHHVETYGDIARLFDFLLATEAVMPLYLFAAIIISRRQELFELEPGAAEMVAVLQKLPETLDLEALIVHSLELFNSYPPEKLPGHVWRRVSTYSVLKTTRNLDSLCKQTLEDGKRYFDKHDAQIRMSQKVSDIQIKLWQARRPAGTVGVAILIGLLAWSIGSGKTSNIASSVWERFQVLMW